MALEKGFFNRVFCCPQSYVNGFSAGFGCIGSEFWLQLLGNKGLVEVETSISRCKG